MPEWTPNARPWPPTQRDPYPHWDHCTFGKGRGSSNSCDCETQEQNDLLEAYWEGYEEACMQRTHPS